MIWRLFIAMGGVIALIAILPLFLILVTMIIGFIKVFISEYFGRKGK